MTELNGVLKKIGVKLKIQDIIDKYNIKKVKTIKNKFTLRYKDPITTFVKTVKLYSICNKDYIVIPRFGAFELLKSGIIDNIFNKLKLGEDVNCNYIGESNENQKVIVKHLMNNIYNKNVNGDAGCTLHMKAGCHNIFTEILMYDGTIKYVQDIKVNDILMGDDSTPRKVLQLCRGNELMYEMHLYNGKKHIINKGHILSLKYFNNNKIKDDKSQFISKCFNKNTLLEEYKYFPYNANNKMDIYKDVMLFNNNCIVDISVEEYLKLPDNIKVKLYCYTLPIEFKEQELLIDPYIYGRWLINKNINNDDIEFKQNIRNLYIEDNGIPLIYKINSRINRLKLISGIINSCGVYTEYNNYMILINNKTLMEDIIFICKSLGLRVIKQLKHSSYILDDNEIKPYYVYQLEIYGYNNQELSIKNIPTIYKDNDSSYLLYSFYITKLDKRNYYGFTLDNNHRYFTSDFICHHNSGKTFVAMDLISKINKKTLIVVPNTFLLKQWLELLHKYFPDNKIGEYYSKKKKDGDIIVSIINSAILNDFTFKTKINKEKIITTYTPIEYYNQFGFIIFDESHKYCSNTFKSIFKVAQCNYMLGLTATPNERLDHFDAVSHLNIGNVLDVEELTNYEKNDVIFESTVEVIKYSGPNEYTNVEINPKNNMINVPFIINQIINDEYRNQLIIDNIKKLSIDNLNIFVFSERRNHLITLYDLLKEQYEEECELSIPEENKNIVLYGGSSDNDIQNAKEKSKVIFTTYQYSSTGVSIVKMNAMILATPRKSNSTQIIGRVFRLGKGQDIHRKIIDIVDDKLPLKYQYNSRKKTYKDRDSIITKTNIDYKDIFLQ